jgi:hypothetical protein
LIDAVLLTAAFWIFAAALWMDVRYLGGALGRISVSAGLARGR